MWRVLACLKRHLRLFKIIKQNLFVLILPLFELYYLFAALIDFRYKFERRHIFFFLILDLLLLQKYFCFDLIGIRIQSFINIRLLFALKLLLRFRNVGVKSAIRDLNLRFLLSIFPLKFLFFLQTLFGFFVKFEILWGILFRFKTLGFAWLGQIFCVLKRFDIIFNKILICHFLLLL